MSNFTFLQTDWPELYETACEAEQNVASTPLSHRALQPCKSTLDLFMSITYNLYKWRLSA